MEKRSESFVVYFLVESSRHHVLHKICTTTVCTQLVLVVLRVLLGCTFIQVHTYMYIHTYIHTYIHECMCTYMTYMYIHTYDIHYASHTPNRRASSDSPSSHSSSSSSLSVASKFTCCIHCTCPTSLFFSS